MKKIEKKFLRYNKSKWKEISVKEVNTLQVFITNKCNLRCKACFYKHKLGKKEIHIKGYLEHVSGYSKKIKKVVILGGEPTLYKKLPNLIRVNQCLGLKTTIYTNGFNLKILNNIDMIDTKLRIGVYGAYKSEKPLSQVYRTRQPVTIVYMLRKDNVDELMAAAKMAESDFNCKNFFISSIRDIADTKSYWEDNEETLPNEKYFKVVQDFLEQYKGQLNIHISKRGVIKSKYELKTDKCRFGNVFPDGKKVRCPFDISLDKTCKRLSFGKVKCNKDNLCLLRKMVLQKIT